MIRPRAAVFFCLYVCAVVYLSLYPWEFLLQARFPRLVWVPVVGLRQTLDAVLNFFFYVPLGFTGAIAIRRGPLSGWRCWLLSIAAGGALSWTIEWLQLWCPSRYGNLTDLASNVAGTIAGASVGMAAVRRKWLPDRLQGSRWHVEPAGVLLLGVWILWQMFPFIPALSLFRLRQLPTSVAPWSWRLAVATGLGFAVLRWAMGERPKMATMWMCLAYAALPAQAVLLNRRLSFSALAGAAAAWVVAELAGKRDRLAPILLLSWLVFEELRPFRFAQEQQTFAWAPFGSWYEVSSVDYYPVLFGKLFFDLAVLWSLRERGVRWIQAVAVPAGIIAVGEWAQLYIPGRTPESTDVVLLFAAAVLLALLPQSRNSEPR